MAVITFPDEQVWLAARWAFRQLLEDVRDRLPDDREVAEEFERATALDGLHLGEIEPSVAERVSRELRQFTVGFLRGSQRSKVAERYPDAESQEMYRSGVAQLAKLLAISRE